MVLEGPWPPISAEILSWQLESRHGTLFTTDHINFSISYVQELSVNPLYLQALLRSAYPLATSLMGVSEELKKDLCRLGAFADERVTVIYNPVVRGLAIPATVDLVVRQQFWVRASTITFWLWGVSTPKRTFPCSSGLLPNYFIL